jgi:hypothetical protein
MSPTDFRHNHYVPEWYQRRFMWPDQTKYFYLDLKPEDVTTATGHKYKRRELLPWGPSRCFAQDNLYTTKWGRVENVDIEKFFFGQIDNSGPEAIDYFANFKHPGADEPKFHNLLTYMSVQKLRTPKGLAWLNSISKARSQNFDLLFLQQIRNVFCATWTECVWQIADAEKSKTKFIVSDHPMTVYNRGCFPFSDHCKGFNDPDIRYVATHTLFPLSLNKILIFTNLAWVRNPYQSETKMRPNPDLFRPAMFNFTDIQIFRSLSEQEVLEINFLIKRRAFRYLAAADRDWLYPENFLKNTHWRNFGDGWLLMPEPRAIHMGGEIYIGYKDGSHDAFSAYGHKPWQKGFEDKKRDAKEFKTLERFKLEFAYRQGPAWRGSDFSFGSKAEPRVDSDDYHSENMKRLKTLRKQQKKTRR